VLYYQFMNMTTPIGTGPLAKGPSLGKLFLIALLNGYIAANALAAGMVAVSLVHRCLSGEAAIGTVVVAGAVAFVTFIISLLIQLNRRAMGVPRMILKLIVIGGVALPIIGGVAVGLGSC
jgi:hypothetical protein